MLAYFAKKKNTTVGGQSPLQVVLPSVSDINIKSQMALIEGNWSQT